MSMRAFIVLPLLLSTGAAFAQDVTCHNNPLLKDQHFPNSGVPPLALWGAAGAVAVAALAIWLIRRTRS